LVLFQAEPEDFLAFWTQLLLRRFTPTGSLLLVGIEVKSLSTQQPLKQPL
jgi:hypothetical protein